MSIDASAKNMQAVCKAKEHHDKTCPWGGKGTHVHLSWFDIERMGWEEGDVICGLVVVGDERVATGMMRVTCDAEPEDDRFESERGGGGRRGRLRARARHGHAPGRARRPALVPTSHRERDVSGPPRVRAP